MGAPAQALTSEAMDELSIEIRKRLLAATAWQEALSEYAKATRLAVALVDSEGQLIGELFNPQPLWVVKGGVKVSHCGGGKGDHFFA